MPSGPKISIITVCRNTGKFLDKCLESIVTQDYDNFECIIQDSESTDETPRILEDFARRYPDKVFVKIERDTGIGDAINRALQRATGDIIGILLSDERYRPGALQWAADAFSRHPDAAVIFGDYYAVDAKYHILRLNRPGPCTYEQLFCSEKVLPCPSTFIQSCRLREEGWYADPKMTTCPDFELWTRLGLKHPVLYVPGAVAENMVHPESSTFRPSTYPRFVELKKYVLGKIVESPGTPAKIRALATRAEGGLYRWAGDSVFHRDRIQALKWYWESFKTYPALNVILRAAALAVPAALLRAWQNRSFQTGLREASLSMYRKYRQRIARPRNLEGDRDIEWSFIAASIPDGPGRALDFGSGGGPLGLAAARRGYEVLAADLRAITWPYRHEKLRFVQGDALKMGLKDESFDLILNCSTVEHVGLSGRYGVTEQVDDGDLRAMTRLRELLAPGGTMLLTVPVGLDAVFMPNCRVYGRQRLPQLLKGYEIAAEEYWIKDTANQWVRVSRDEALAFDSSMESGDALQNVCALGCFILKKKREQLP